MYLDPTSSTAEAGPTAEAPSAPLAATLTTLALALTDRRPPAPAADDLAEVLRRLRDGVPGTAAASVLAASIIAAKPPARAANGATAGAPTTVAATSDLARTADQQQLAAGAGPSLDARERPVHAGGDQLTHRWPAAGSRLRELGVSAVLALPLPGLAGRAALTFYADAPLPIDALAPAGEAAAVAAVALVGLETRERAANLEIALATSRQIAAAVGIVMAQQRCSYEDAFQRIRAVSQRTHRKMRELADAIVFTGALPDLGGSVGRSVGGTVGGSAVADG